MARTSPDAFLDQLIDWIEVEQMTNEVECEVRPDRLADVAE